MKYINHPAIAIIIGAICVLACGMVIATSNRDGHDDPAREQVRTAIETFVGPGSLELTEYTPTVTGCPARVKFRPATKFATSTAPIDARLRKYTVRCPKFTYSVTLDRAHAEQLANTKLPAWWHADQTYAVWLPGSNGVLLNP